KIRDLSTRLRGCFRWHQSVCSSARVLNSRIRENEPHPWLTAEQIVGRVASIQPEAGRAVKTSECGVKRIECADSSAPCKPATCRRPRLRVLRPSATWNALTSQRL